MERRTRQRDAITGVFEAHSRPLSPAEVLEQGRLSVHQLGISTVYRTIAALVASGWLTPVNLPGESARYERAGAGHHHHFRCRVCERVFEIHACPGDMNQLAPPGFKLEDHEVVLYGRCGVCAC